ncbi:MAG: P22 coat protein - protein 5 domain protein [Clostridia bacterium]|nr:P22 coat protein - protein 5 domain protein [Clostridia bacterium]
MAIQNFIPTLWSETLYTELEKDYVGVKLSSREFEGDIRGEGDRVKICGIGPVTVFDYNKNEDMPAAEVLSDTERTLIIDQAKGFNFFLDSIDLAQSKKSLMQAAMKEASGALSDVADRYIYSLTDENVAVLENDDVNSTNIISIIADARRILMENNVPNSAKISLEVPPAIEQKLVLAKVLRSTDNVEALGRGYIGSFMGFDIYVTNNITPSGDGSYRCIARTGRAIAFAEQVSAVKAYEPELRHGDAVKGLHLYGAKIIYPKEMVFLNLTPGEEDMI